MPIGANLPLPRKETKRADCRHDHFLNVVINPRRLSHSRFPRRHQGLRRSSARRSACEHLAHPRKSSMPRKISRNLRTTSEDNTPGGSVEQRALMRTISMWQVCRGLTRPYKSVNALRSRRKTRRRALDWLEPRTLLSNASWTGTTDGKSRPDRQVSRSQAFAA